MILDYLPDPKDALLIASVWTGIAVLLAVLVFLHRWLQAPRGWRSEELEYPSGGVLSYPGELSDEQLDRIKREWRAWANLPVSAECFHERLEPVQVLKTDEVLPGYWGFIGTDLEASQSAAQAPATAPTVEVIPNLDKDQTPVPVAVKRARAKRPRKAKRTIGIIQE